MLNWQILCDTRSWVGTLQNTTRSIQHWITRLRNWLSKLSNDSLSNKNKPILNMALLNKKCTQPHTLQSWTKKETASAFRPITGSNNDCIERLGTFLFPKMPYEGNECIRKFGILEPAQLSFSFDWARLQTAIPYKKNKNKLTKLNELWMSWRVISGKGAHLLGKQLSHLKTGMQH